MDFKNYNINILFTSDNFSRASLSNGTINIFVQKNNNFKTILMILISFFAHEYTHFLRSRTNKYNYTFYNPKNNYEYYLNPEEMIAFYNQLIIESYFRCCTFKKCLSSFLRRNINEPSVAKRFYNGMITLYTTKKFLSIKCNIEIVEEIKNKLDLLSSYVDKWALTNVPNYSKEMLNQQKLDIFKKLDVAF